MKTRRRPSGSFTLVELLIALAIIALLAALAMPAYHGAQAYAIRTGSLSNMRQIGLAFRLYANDNDQLLPGRVTGQANKWPVLLTNYLGSTRIYVAPGDTNAIKQSPATLVSNSKNQTSYIFNGFNDEGSYTNSSVEIRLINIPSPVNLILLAQKYSTKGDFYMDFVEGNQANVIVTNAFGNGANYVFADGSARFMKTNEYSDQYWLIDQNYQIPPVPKR